MFEKVNPQHPDKVADRIAGAIVDLAYNNSVGGFEYGNPRVAVEVLLGHGSCTCIIETSLGRNELRQKDVKEAISRIAGERLETRIILVGQDEHLAKNQEDFLRCGDNGIFRGRPVTKEQADLTSLAHELYDAFKTDGKYIMDNGNVVVCQSNATEKEIKEVLDTYGFKGIKVNPLGFWTGGADVDSGATNRKLGSDMGDAVTGGGLHGKDLSKADVSVNIVCHILAQKTGEAVEASCAIGDEFVTFHYGGTKHTIPFSDIVEQARIYVNDECGSFEKLAEWGLIRK